MSLSFFPNKWKADSHTYTYKSHLEENNVGATLAVLSLSLHVKSHSKKFNIVWWLITRLLLSATLLWYRLSMILPVLYRRSRVPWALHPDHYHGHEEEVQGKYEAYPVDRQVTHCRLAVKRDLSWNVVGTAVRAKWYLLKASNSNATVNSHGFSIIRDNVTT